MPHAAQLQQAHQWATRHTWLDAATALQVTFKGNAPGEWYVALGFDDPPHTFVEPGLALAMPALAPGEWHASLWNKIDLTAGPTHEGADAADSL